MSREHSKLLAKELMVFADKNEKEIVSDFKSGIQTQMNDIDNAIYIIEKEAAALQTLGDYVSRDKKDVNDHLGTLFDQMLTWLTQMEKSFQTVDTETKKMHDTIQNFGINDKLNKIILKTSTVTDKLNSILYKTQFTKQNNTLKSIDENVFNDWYSKVKKMNKND